MARTTEWGSASAAPRAAREPARPTTRILLHYFDSRTTFIDTISEGTQLRALVVRSRAPSSTQTALVEGGRIKGSDGEYLERSRWTFDTPGVDGRAFPTTWRLVLVGSGRTGAWHLEVQDATGKTRASFTDGDARITVTPVPQGAGPAVTRVLVRSSSTYDTYAGTIRIGRVDGRIRVVNHVPIESFVRSVVPEEMGRTNHPEALKAQAVATRSYFIAGRNRGSTSRFLGYDVVAYRETHSYKGVHSEVPVVSEAVDATAYQVLRWVDGDGSNRVIRAFYHAVGGGATEASMNVFTTEKGKPGTRVPYLMGGSDVDEDGDAYDERSPMYEWQTRALTLEQLSTDPGQGPAHQRGQAPRLAGRHGRGLPGAARRGAPRGCPRPDTRAREPGHLGPAHVDHPQGCPERQEGREARGGLGVQAGVQQASRHGRPAGLDDDLPGARGRLTRGGPVVRPLARGAPRTGSDRARSRRPWRPAARRGCPARRCGPRPSRGSCRRPGWWTADGR